MRACIYDTDGRIVESYEGDSARWFATHYTGEMTLRCDEPMEGAEVGEVYPAGYLIDGTPPAPRVRRSIWEVAAGLPPLQARAYVVGLMKRRCRTFIDRYRDANDPDFGDDGLLAEAIATRDELKAAIASAQTATSAQELRAAWAAMKTAMKEIDP